MKIMNLFRNKAAMGIASLALMLAAATAITVTGCKTATTSTTVVTQGPNGPVTNIITGTNTTLLGVVITPTSVYNTLRGGTATCARIAIKADTNATPYLVALRQVLGDSLNSTNYDPAALAAAVNALPISSIHNPTAVEAVQGGFAAFEIIQPIIDANVTTHSQFLKPALQGVYDGIGDALGIASSPLMPTSMTEPTMVIPGRECAQANWTMYRNKGFEDAVKEQALNRW